MSDAPDFVVSIIKRHWNPGKKILEVGCGPSFLRKHFGEDYIGSDITNDDYTEGLPRDVDIICAADELKINTSSIDIVVIKSAFFLFPNYLKSLEEAIRVLKPKGKLLIFDYNAKTQKSLQKKEKHQNYPCWSQWKLKKLTKATKKMKNVENYIASNIQPKGVKKIYSLIKQEVLGNWAIVCGEKI